MNYCSSTSRIALVLSRLVRKGGDWRHHLPQLVSQGPIWAVSRNMGSTPVMSDPFRPAKRVAGQKQDVWYIQNNPHFESQPIDIVDRTIVNEAAAKSPIQPIINMGQGFL